MFMVDVTLSHDFIGTGQTGLNQGQGQLRSLYNPDYIFESAAEPTRSATIVTGTKVHTHTHTHKHTDIYTHKHTIVCVMMMMSFICSLCVFVCVTLTQLWSWTGPEVTQVAVATQVAVFIVSSCASADLCLPIAHVAFCLARLCDSCKCKNRCTRP